MVVESHIQQYSELGFVRVPAVFTAAEIAELSDALDRLIADWAVTNEGWVGPWRQTIMGDDLAARSRLTHLNDIHHYSAAWLHAALNPRLLDCVSDLIGSNVELHHTTLHCKPPETGMPFPMHQDSPFYQHEGPGYVDAIVHVDGSTGENGCLKFLPASHLLGHLEHITQGSSPHLPTSQYRLQDAVACPANAGDVVLFSIYTVHGSDVNRTDRIRRLVRIGYRDPANHQVGGHRAGQLGPIVRGVREANR